jgi:hypothetical protein
VAEGARDDLLQARMSNILSDQRLDALRLERLPLLAMNT